MPDGAEFLTIARTLEGPQGAFSTSGRAAPRCCLGCDIGFKDEIVYGAALPGWPAGVGAASRAGAGHSRSALPVGCASASRLPCALRAAGHPPARPGRDGDRAERVSTFGDESFTSHLDDAR
jgi:predicted transcriptional regulator